MIRSSFRFCASSCKLLKAINTEQQNIQSRCIKRWVAPTLFELRRRAKLQGPQLPQPRSGFIEWNYRAELFAFGKRLNEEFQLETLQTALRQRSYVLNEEQKQEKLGIEKSDLNMNDNRKLTARGERLCKEYINAYLRESLPKVPQEGIDAFSKYLLSASTLANIALHLGLKELILTVEYPPSEESLCSSLLAVIGALEESSGVERATLFVRDFICTQLNQKDLLELWEIEKPEELLARVCQERKLGTVEPRLIGDCGQNTILAAYHVGLYSNKQLIGKGFGEDISTAIKVASLDALQSLFEIHDNMRPFNFQLKVQTKLNI